MKALSLILFTLPLIVLAQVKPLKIFWPVVEGAQRLIAPKPSPSGHRRARPRLDNTDQRRPAERDVASLQALGIKLVSWKESLWLWYRSRFNQR